MAFVSFQILKFLRHLCCLFFNNVKDVLLQSWNSGLKVISPKQPTENHNLTDGYDKTIFAYERGKEFKNV